MLLTISDSAEYTTHQLHRMNHQGNCMGEDMELCGAIIARVLYHSLWNLSHLSHPAPALRSQLDAAEALKSLHPWMPLQRPAEA